MFSLVNKIRANPKVSLKLVVGMDDICGLCKWWDHKKGICTRELKTHPEDNANSFTLDKNIIRFLGMEPGDAISAASALRTSRALVAPALKIKRVPPK